MATDNKVRRPVSFNKTKSPDVELLKFIGRRNFSGYVKKLIREDMERKQEGVEKEVKEETVQIPTEKVTEEEKREPTPFRELAQDSVVPETERVVSEVSETVEERLKRLKGELAKQPASTPKVFINNHLKK